MKSRTAPLLAVLFDADNIPSEDADAILSEISTLGEPALRRVYGDWSDQRLKNWIQKARELGLVTHQLASNTRGNNATDIGLVIDAMDILHSGRFDGFVLVSSDSDFTALASRIRENGHQVIGVGEKKTPTALRSVCNRFIMIENLRIQVETEKENSETETPLKQPGKLIALIMSAMRSIDPDGEWYRLSDVGSHMVRANPDFDTRTYGRSKLSELVKMLIPFELRKQGTHLEIRVKSKDET